MKYILVILMLVGLVGCGTLNVVVDDAKCSRIPGTKKKLCKDAEKFND